MSESKEKQTYDYNEINLKLKEFISNIESKYSFLNIEEPKSFKHYIDKESYHYTINFTINMDEKFLKEKYHANKINFPLEFDLDVGTITKQYADYILAEMFEKFDYVCSNMKAEYENFKEPKKNKENKSNYFV